MTVAEARPFGAAALHPELHADKPPVIGADLQRNTHALSGHAPFGLVVALTEPMAMPEDDGDQRAARGEALRIATQPATKPALATLAAAREALALAVALAGRVNPEAASDLGVAVHSSFRRIHAEIETARASAATVTAIITPCLGP